MIIYSFWCLFLLTSYRKWNSYSKRLKCFQGKCFRAKIWTLSSESTIHEISTIYGVINFVLNMKTENFFRFKVIKSTVHGNNIRLKNSLNFSSYVSFVLFEALSLSSRSSQFAEGYFILIITCGGGISLFISHSSYELIMAISLSKYLCIW